MSRAPGREPGWCVLGNTYNRRRRTSAAALPTEGGGPQPRLGGPKGPTMASVSGFEPAGTTPTGLRSGGPVSLHDAVRLSAGDPAIALAGDPSHPGGRSARPRVLAELAHRVPGDGAAVVPRS